MMLYINLVSGILSCVDVNHQWGAGAGGLVENGSSTRLWRP